MITILILKQQTGDGFPFLKVILFIYFIPSIVALIRSPVLRWKVFSVIFINIFFGWTFYGWWISFIKAFSSRNIIYVKTKSKGNVALDKYDQLNKLNNLRSSGAINEEEFEFEKKKILNQ